MRRWLGAALGLLMMLTTIASLPTAKAQEIYVAGPGASIAEVSVFKGGNGYYYVFYSSTGGLRYAYSDNPAEGWASGIITTETIDSFNVGYFGGTTVIIPYVTGSTVKAAKCTVATPLSCTIVTVRSNAPSAQRLKTAYQPNSGYYYISYTWFNSGGGKYLLTIYRSSTGDSWTNAYEDIMDSNVGGGFPIVTGIAALTDTTDKVVAVAGKYDTPNYWYCRGSSSFCAQLWTSIGSKSSDLTSDVVAIPRGNSGAEVFATTSGSTRWLSFTGSNAIDRGSFGASPVRPAIVGNQIDLYWVSGNNIYRRTADASAGSLGSSIVWLTVPGLEAVSVERFPSSLSSAAVVYQANFGNVYFRYATQTNTVSISETVSASDQMLKIKQTAIALSETLNAIDTGARFLGFTAQLAEALTTTEVISQIHNHVINVIENIGSSEFFAGLPNYLLPEILTATDTLTSSLFKASPGGGGGGGGGFVPPPTTPEPPPPPEIPTTQVAWGSIVGVSVMLGVLAIGLIRERRKPVALWRRRSGKKPLKRRRTWRIDNVFK